VDRPVNEKSIESSLEHLVRESLLSEEPPPPLETPSVQPWIEPPQAQIQVRGVEDPELLHALAALARMGRPAVAQKKALKPSNEFTRANPDSVQETDFKPDSLLRRPRDASPILRPKPPRS
jgi:hypothetical protein